MAAKQKMQLRPTAQGAMFATSLEVRPPVFLRRYGCEVKSRRSDCKPDCCKEATNLRLPSLKRLSLQPSSNRNCYRDEMAANPLAIATQHAMRGLRIVARHRQLIAELQASGHDTASAEELLERIVVTQSIFDAYWIAIAKKRPPAGPGGWPCDTGGHSPVVPVRLSCGC